MIHVTCGKNPTNEWNETKLLVMKSFSTSSMSTFNDVNVNIFDKTIKAYEAILNALNIAVGYNYV